MSKALETAKIFMTGRSQAVRLPKSCRFDGIEVFAQKVGNTVVLTPKSKAWESMWTALDEFDFEPGFQLGRDQGAAQQREELFP